MKNDSTKDRTQKTNEKPEAEVFAEMITTVEFGSELYLKLASHFSDEMRKAVNQGRICTPERMALLYPIFREINIEMDEIDKYWRKMEIKDKTRAERKANKKVSND